MWSWLKREKYIISNPFEQVKPPNTTERIVEPLTPGDVSKLLKAIPRNEYTGYRDSCVIITLYGTGLRISEVFNRCNTPQYRLTLQLDFFLGGQDTTPQASLRLFTYLTGCLHLDLWNPFILRDHSSHINSFSEIVTFWRFNKPTAISIPDDHYKPTRLAKI